MTNFPIRGKVVPVLNQVPRNEDVLGSGGTNPRNCNLGTSGQLHALATLP